MRTKIGAPPFGLNERNPHPPKESGEMCCSAEATFKAARMLVNEMS
jgi:hypothetical protein